METLSKIFGSKDRVKIMRLFLFNDETPFDIDDITTRSKVTKTAARKELNMLVKIGFIKPKNFSKEFLKKSRSKKKKPPEYVSKRVKGWMMNHNFDLKDQFANLLVESEFMDEKQVSQRIRKSGTVHVLALSGLFIGDHDRALDILVVGNKINRSSLQREIANIEAEIGRELSYSLFDVSEFKYRMSMYDKLIRDVLEYDPMLVIDRIGLE